MKKITINSETRQLSQASTTVGYLQENKVEKLEFEIPEEYKTYGRKACFKAQDKTFAKIFDDITGNTLTLTRDMTQYDELEMSIAFFKTENEDEIVARTSILKIYIENAIICDDDIQPDDPKVVILDELIQKVTKLNDQVTKDEEIRQNQEATRQQNETTREENEQGRVFDELGRKKAEEERKTNELERISNENTREEYINNLKAQVDNGEFDGADFNYKWDGTKLGVKNSKETTYQFVELKGQKGDKGDTGNGIQNIEKLSTVENVDTYAIHYTDGTQTTFNVTNGEVTKEQLDEVDNRAKKTRNELERVKNDILETGTASDSFINVQDSAWAELQELSVDGVCEQTTTTGKNSLDYVSNIIPSNNGLTSVINEDGSITTTGKPTKNYSTITKSINITDILEDKNTYTISQKVPGNLFIQINIAQLDGTLKYINSNRKPSSFVVDKSIYKTYTLIIQTSSMTEWGDSPLTITNKYMLCKGTDTADTSFEPYTGGQPSPSPDYPQEIETITGNLKLTSCDNGLFDGELRQGSWNSINDNTRCFNKNNIYAEAGDYLLITNLDVSNYRYGILVSNDNFPLNSENFSYNSGWRQANKFEFSLTESGNLGINVSSINNANINPSTFTNVKWLLIRLDLASIIEANLPEGEFIGKLNETYKDELVAVYNQEEGQYHLILNKVIGKKVVDGNTGNIAKIGDNCFGINGAIKNFLHFSEFIIDNNKNNKYITLAQTSSNSNFFNISKDYNYAMNFTSSENFNNIRIKDIRLNTVDELKQSLNEKPIEVYYTLNLNSRYSLDLGPIDIPLSYNEVTNIFTDSDLLPQINAKYYRNFTKTVQNLQVNEKALKQELIDINNRLTALETAKASESEVNNDIPVE